MACKHKNIYHPPGTIMVFSQACCLVLTFLSSRAKVPQNIVDLQQQKKVPHRPANINTPTGATQTRHYYKGKPSRVAYICIDAPRKTCILYTSIWCNHLGKLLEIPFKFLNLNFRSFLGWIPLIAPFGKRFSALWSLLVFPADPWGPSNAIRVSTSSKAFRHSSGPALSPD